MLPLSEAWACLWEMMKSSCGVMGEGMTHRVAFKAAFSLFLAFDAPFCVTAFEGTLASQLAAAKHACLDPMICHD